MLPVEVVLRTCSADALRAAIAAGDVLEVEWSGEPAVSLVEVAETEEMLADGLAGLAAENRLVVVVGPAATGRAQSLATALDGVPAVVLDDAHRSGIDDVLAAVEDLPETSVLALSLDPALPLAAVPGAVALDLAASGICPVLQATVPPARTTLARARADVAAGRWFDTNAEDRTIVEVRVTSPEEALARVGQLVSTSIPRAFDIAASQVAVLLGPGSLEPDAVRAALQGADVVLLTGPLERGWEAVVVVLGPPGPATTRALVYAGLMAGDRHVSVVHPGDPAAFTATMAGSPDRPRRTRLAALLAG